MGYFEPVELTIGLKTVPRELDKFPELLLTKPSHDEENKTAQNTQSHHYYRAHACQRMLQCSIVFFFFPGFLYTLFPFE